MVSSYKNILIGITILLYPTGGVAESQLDNDIRMAVTAAFVSEKGLPVYNELANYLSEKISRPVKTLEGVSYSESSQLLHQGIIHVGFVCGLPYTHAKQKNDVKLLAVPVMALKRGTYSDVPGYETIPGKYFSYTIVHKNSLLRNWQDLRDHSYAYNDQQSNSGYNMPRYKLVQLGFKRWEKYFSKIVVSSSHEESIRLVARGIVDASSVDSLVLDYDRHIGNADAHNVKVIEVMFPGGSGIPPVVASARADPSVMDKLQHALLNMHKDKKGKAILDKALILRFDPPDDSNYNDIRLMEKAAHDAGFVDHVP